MTGMLVEVDEVVASLREWATAGPLRFEQAAELVAERFGAAPEPEPTFRLTVVYAAGNAQEHEGLTLAQADTGLGSFSRDLFRLKGAGVRSVKVEIEPVAAEPPEGRWVATTRPPDDEAYPPLPTGPVR